MIYTVTKLLHAFFFCTDVPVLVSSNCRIEDFAPDDEALRCLLNRVWVLK